jgi:hypothetical protein
MARKITFTLPTSWERRWEKIKKILKTDDTRLLKRLIKHEIDTWESKRRIEAHERVERALAIIDDLLGEEEMLEFAKKVELIAKKIKETRELW